VAQRQIPGGVLVDETSLLQRQIPGSGFVNEALSASTLTLPASKGAFAFSFPEISFDFSPVADDVLDADSLSLTTSGSAANLRHGYHISVDAGTFTLSVAPSLSDVEVTSAVGSFALTGNAAVLTLQRKLLTSSTGTFTITANDAVLEPSGTGSSTFQAETGAFSLTGPDITLSRGATTMIAESGTFTLTGYEIIAQAIFPVDTGSFTVTGSDASFSLNLITEWTRRGRPSTTWTRV
jgi:hypothetical protein